MKDWSNIRAILQNHGVRGGMVISTDQRGMTIKSGALTVEGNVIKIGNQCFDRRAAPLDLATYNQYIQDTYWDFCFDSARIGATYINYTDNVLSQHGIDLNAQTHLTDNQKNAIRKNAKKVGKIVQILQQDFATDYFSLYGVSDVYQENINLLTKHVKILLTGLQRLGLRVDLCDLLRIPPKVFEAMTSHKSNAKITVKFIKILKSHGVDNTLNVVLSMDQKKLLHLIDDDETVKRAGALLTVLRNLGYQDPFGKMLGLDFSSLEYLVEYDDQLNRASWLMSYLQEYEISQDPLHSLFSIPRERLEFIIEYDRHEQLSEKLMATLILMGCSCPWETLVVIPEEQLNHLLEYDKQFYKGISKLKKGITKPTPMALELLNTLKPKQWAAALDNNSYVRHLIKFGSYLEKYKLDFPSWALGFKPKFIQMMAGHNADDVCKLLQWLKESGVDPLVMLTELGPCGFKMAMHNPEKLLLKLKQGYDLSTMIKNSWDFEQKPIRDLFVSKAAFQLCPVYLDINNDLISHLPKTEADNSFQLTV